MSLDSHQARQIIAANLRQLMRANARLRGIVAVGNKAGVGPSTVARTLHQDAAISVDVLERLASAFGLEAYQLLIPQLDPFQPQGLPHVTHPDDAITDFDTLNSAEMTQWVGVKPKA